MGKSSAELDGEKMEELKYETTNKSKHIKNNHFRSRSFRAYRYLCIWRCKFTWNLCRSICSHTAAIWNQTRINSNQIKIIKETMNNAKTGISSSKYGSTFSK